MAVYFGLFFATLFNSFFSLTRSFPVKPIAALIFLLIFFIVAFRYASVDYFGYLGIYEGVTDFSRLGWFIYSVNEMTPVESGFALLILLEKIFVGHFFFFLFVFAALSMAVKYYALSKLSPYVLLSVLIYLSDEYFWKDLGQIRNAMASGILLVSILFAHKREPVKFFITLFIASLFHSAAIVGIVIYFLRHLAKPALMAIALILSIGVAIAGGVGLLIPEVASVLGFDSASRLVKYANSKYVGEGSFLRGTNLLHVAISLLFIYFYKPLVRKWSYNQLLVPMYVYGTVLMFLFVDYGIIWGRIREMLCIPAFVVVAPSFILLFKGNQRLIPYFIIVAYCVMFFYLKIQDRAPYQSVLGLIG